MQAIEHFVYARTVRQLIREIDGCPSGHIVFLIGLSGVGKTSARYAALRELFGHPMYWGAGRIPVIDTHALLPSNAFYSSMGMSETLVDQFSGPNLRWLTHGVEKLSADTLAIIAEVDQARGMLSGIARRRFSESDCWSIVRRLAHARGCKVICIDHATALLRNRANLQPAQHIEHLVSLAEDWDLKLVMTGIHRVHHLWEVHPELRRRIHKV